MVSDQIATTPYAGKMILGAQQAALDNGWWLLLVNTDGDPGVEAASITYLRQHDCDGVVLAWMYHRMVDVPDALAGVPTVLLDAESRDVSIPAVVPDEVAGGRAAVATLLEAGHRRIGFITNVDDIPATSGRLQGYREALRQAGVRFDRRLVTTDESVTAGGYRAAERLLAAAEPPTALFCFNDRMAMGAYRAASERGLRIPQDLSIVGFDDQQIIAEGLFPALTTVALPHLEMGRWAVERMIELIENPESTSPNPYLMRCPVVVRDSVGPPPC
jgi:LacI family transcriptional regulator